MFNEFWPIPLTSKSLIMACLEDPMLSGLSEKNRSVGKIRSVFSRFLSNLSFDKNDSWLMRSDLIPSCLMTSSVDRLRFEEKLNFPKNSWARRFLLFQFVFLYSNIFFV